jgi:signal transduction histidine kinase
MNTRWWPNQVPLRLRVFFRSAFTLLALATVALAVFELREEKQLSYRAYHELFDRNTQQIVARLQHPSGQLALLNPSLPGATLAPLHPLLLPFSAIDFDDKAKAQQAAEMAGCLVQYPQSARLCVAVGNNPVTGGFIYAVGSFASGPLVTHELGDLQLDHAHRVIVDVSLRGRSYRWVAPLEAEKPPAHSRFSARLAGFEADATGQPADRPDHDFRGWLWQDSRCLSASDPDSPAGCLKRAFFSVRLPVALFTEELRDRGVVWPPKDLAQIQVHIQVCAPGIGSPLFDSNRPGASAPFALSDLKTQLLAGESLRIHRLDPASSGDVISLTYEAEAPSAGPHLLQRLVARLPVPSGDHPLFARQIISTPVGEFEVLLKGDPHSADSTLASLAGRLALFAAAIMAAIALTWAAIEQRIIHRITLLTQRAASVRHSVDETAGPRLDLQGLRSGDELGLLAGVLADLLQRISEDAKREQLRIEQEKNMWHAVGHEIMAPLQSLSALHTAPADPSVRYVNRMRQAVRVLYGSASPSDAFQSAPMQVQTLDVNAFLQTVADNAAHAGIDQVSYHGVPQAVIVKADEYPLEDVVTHVLSNADRHREQATPIQMSLRALADSAEVRIHNVGRQIDAAMLGKIFEYGVSDADPGEGSAHRGQGLFVARTYMAKMGGTIEAVNVEDGVEFVLRLGVA